MAMVKNVLLINGPNINLLGTREPSVYGSTTLADIEARLKRQAESSGAKFQSFQSNHEGEIVDCIHKAKKDGIEAIIINPAAFTHTSIAIRDAFLAVSIPLVEVHITNIHRREEFRRHSYISDIAVGSIVGLGTDGYRLAMDYVLTKL